MSDAISESMNESKIDNLSQTDSCPSADNYLQDTIQREFSLVLPIKSVFAIHPNPVTAQNNQSENQNMFSQEQPNLDLPLEADEEFKESDIFNFINIKKTSHSKRIRAMLERKQMLETDGSPLRKRAI